jgi:hypothetical protein
VSSHSESIDWATSISGPSMSSESESVDVTSTIFTAYCQCVEEYSLVECLTCGSYFVPNTYCPGC